MFTRPLRSRVAKNTFARRVLKKKKKKNQAKQTKTLLKDQPFNHVLIIKYALPLLS